MSSKLAKKYTVPEAFPQILHDYIREVVRYRPKDIFDFSIQYFYFIEKSLPFHFVEGGSNQIPLCETMDMKEKKQINRNKEISTPSATTEQATENLFYKHNENNNLVIKLSKDKKPVTPIDSVGNSIEDSKQKDSIDQQEKPLSTFSGISGTSSQKNSVRRFVGDVFKESEIIAINQLEKEKNSTFSGVSGTSTAKNGVKNFVSDVIKESEDEINELLKKKLEKTQ